MAAGRRREERTRVVELAGWVGALFGESASAYAIHQFVKNGAMPDGSDQKMPDDPEVDAMVAKIERDGGLIVDGQ
jgi:hypothetical protein